MAAVQGGACLRKDFLAELHSSGALLRPWLPEPGWRRVMLQIQQRFSPAAKAPEVLHRLQHVSQALESCQDWEQDAAPTAAVLMAAMAPAVAGSSPAEVSAAAATPPQTKGGEVEAPSAEEAPAPDGTKTIDTMAAKLALADQTRSGRCR